MRAVGAWVLSMIALAVPARAQTVVPDPAVILFAPGSAEVTSEARNALLGFLRPPRPPGFRGQCLRGHADRGPTSEALAHDRARAIAAVMARQGIDPRDIEMEAMGDRLPARLAPPGRAEPMNDRVELSACPGPRLAGVAQARDRALDVAVLPAFVNALAPRVARAMGCTVPDLPRQAMQAPPFICPDGVPAAYVPVLILLRVAGTHRVAVVLEWPRGFGGEEGRWRASAAAGSVLDLFGLPTAPVLAMLAAEPGAARRIDMTAGSLRAEVEAGPGPLRRLRVVPTGADGP